MQSLNIIIPVLNEENRIEEGINQALQYLQSSSIPFLISIVDNGSSDSTQSLAKQLCSTHNAKCHATQKPPLEYIRLEKRGVGLALQTAIRHNSKRTQPYDFIGYMDIDLSTDIGHLQAVYERLCKGDEVVVGSRLLADSQVYGRSIKREISSRGLNLIMKYALNVRFSDAMCGFKFYHATTAQKIMSYASDDSGWFYCAQMLVIAEHLGIAITEIPVIWRDSSAESKVKIISLARSYIREIWRIKQRLKQIPKPQNHAKDLYNET